MTLATNSRLSWPSPPTICAQQLRIGQLRIPMTLETNSRLSWPSPPTICAQKIKCLALQFLGIQYHAHLKFRIEVCNSIKICSAFAARPETKTKDPLKKDRKVTLLNEPMAAQDSDDVSNEIAPCLCNRGELLGRWLTDGLSFQFLLNFAQYFGQFPRL